ncbi:MAG TPA: heme A synthase, partial [Chloroflexota bacterium]|nr:heme A synthase [Chloroflexota bacterium]
MRLALKPLGWAATIGMLLVVVMGAAVTNTGSSEGCGRSWPLCHGQFIPEFAVATLIEFSHRAVAGVEGILVVAFAIGAMTTYRQRVEIRVLAPLMIAFLLLQAGMGAWAVLYPQTPGVIALHFGISSVAFAAVLLGTTFVTSAESGESPRTRPVSSAYRRTVWGTLAYVLIVIYLGAYVRHANYEFACGGWPLCNGSVFPGFDGPVGIAFAHRLAALGSVILLGFLAGWSARIGEARPDLRRGSSIAFGLVLLQSLSGALVVSTGLGLWSALSHAGIMALLFGAVCYLCFESLPVESRGRIVVS